MKKMIFLSLFMLCCQIVGWCNSVNLFNNTDFRLKAVVISADGTVLDEVILNSRDASTWADDFYQFGSDPKMSRTPYTVNWYCMSGKPFGTCTDVASGSVVLAQNCGSRECPEDSDED
jgi:hypothetical protein